MLRFVVSTPSLATLRGFGQLRSGFGRSCRLVSRMALWEGRSPFSSPADAAVGGLAEVLSPSVDAVVGELIPVDRGTNDLPQVDRAHFHGCYERREHLL
jgi:hypothetical protein